MHQRIENAVFFDIACDMVRRFLHRRFGIAHCDAHPAALQHRNIVFRIPEAIGILRILSEHVHHPEDSAALGDSLCGQFASVIIFRGVQKRNGFQPLRNAFKNFLHRGILRKEDIHLDHRLFGKRSHHRHIGSFQHTLGFAENFSEPLIAVSVHFAGIPALQEKTDLTVFRKIDHLPDVFRFNLAAEDAPFMKDANGTGTGDKTVKKRRIIVFGKPLHAAAA